MSRVIFARWLVLMAIAVGVSCACENPIARAGQQDRNSCKNAPKYKVAPHTGGYASHGGVPTLHLQISAPPDSIAKYQLVQLACKLRTDFRKESKLQIWIFTDEHAAERFTFYDKSPTYQQDRAALRGEYYLDRDNRVEWVKYSTDPLKPDDRETICLGAAPCSP